MISASSNAPSRITFACIRCAERKVKCDRQRPCSACTKHNADCVFNTSKPPRRKHKRVKVEALANRLNQYESLLKEHGIDTSQLEGNAELPTRRIQASTNDPNHFQPQDVSTDNAATSGHPGNLYDTTANSRGSTPFKYVENALWTRVIEEVHDPANTLDSSDASSDEDASEDGHSFVLMSHNKSNRRPRHPSLQNIHQLWDIFVDNVDPLLKICHAPTLKPAFQKAASDTSKNIPRSLEALMCAIYSTAIMSLQDEECQQKFAEPQRILLSRYTRATSMALSRAKFMGTTSLVLLQALVLHLLAVRDMFEPRALYALTGVAVRIAQTMGLDRDGTFLGIPPFETEIRRRIWWQLKTHDHRTTELCGLAKFRDLDIGAESTKWPTNVDDDEMYPSMTSLVAAENRVTDILFVAFRCEMTQFAVDRVTQFRKQGLSIDQWNMDETRHDKGEIETAVKELQDTLEMKYIRYCDPVRPLHLLTMLVGRYGMNVVTFLAHHPRSWAGKQISATERRLVWDVSVTLLEQHNMVQSNPVLKKFSWHATYFRQWHAFIHVLDVLRAAPLKSDATKLWALITSTYDNTPAMISDMKKPIHVAMANLCMKAYAAREAALADTNTYLPPTPEFINSLRQWREDAKAKRQARDSRSSPASGSLSHAQNEMLNADHTTTSHTSIGSDQATCAFAGEDALTDARTEFQPSTYGSEDPFYLFDTFDNNQIISGGTDFDLTILEDHNMNDGSFEPINWEQWDTWLANSNVIRT